MFRTRDFLLLMISCVLLFAIAGIFLPSGDTNVEVSTTNEIVFPVSTPETYTIVVPEDVPTEDEEARERFMEKVRQAYRGPDRSPDPEPVVPQPTPQPQPPVMTPAPVVAPASTTPAMPSGPTTTTPVATPTSSSTTPNQ